nr:immunoglobulin heavy chain junction region [Mus musculus]
CVRPYYSNYGYFDVW